MPEIIQKNDDTEIQIAVKSYKGKAYVDIRQFFKSEDMTKMLPTKKGITIPLDKWEDFRSIIDGIDTSKVEEDRG